MSGDLKLEQLAKFLAELINGGEFYNSRWYTEEQRNLWRKHASCVMQQLEKIL